MCHTLESSGMLCVLLLYRYDLLLLHLQHLEFVKFPRIMGVCYAAWVRAERTLVMKTGAFHDLDKLFPNYGDRHWAVRVVWQRGSCKGQLPLHIHAHFRSNEGGCSRGVCVVKTRRERMGCWHKQAVWPASGGGCCRPAMRL